MPSDSNARIEQFKKMAEADPNNELGHFSLGKAYLEADRPKDATTPLARALALNPSLSKAYQLLGDAWKKVGDRAQAVDVLTRGVQVADEQGDRMPLESMVQLLQEFGAPVPTLRTKAKTEGAPSVGSSSTGFRCARCGRPDDQLERPPFKGPLGQRIANRTCRSCWREWIPMGTKVINELGLSLSNPQAQETFDQYMVEFLQLDDD